MKVCAHMALSPYGRDFKRFDSGVAAKQWLWNYLYPQGMLGPYDPNYPITITIYPQCKDCTSEMCFHDYPMYQWVVGPRGGIRRENV